MDGFDWTPEFLTVAVLGPKDPDEPAAGVEPEILEECKGFPDADESFEDFLDGLLRDALTRRADTGASSPTKVHAFAASDKGESDREMLEQGMLMATDLGGFKKRARELLQRLAELPDTTPGLAVVLRARASFEGPQGESGAQLACLFSLPYQDAHIVDRREGLALARIAEVVVRKQARSVVYPFLDAGEVRHDQVKITARPASGSFPGLLATRPPPVTEELLQREVARALYARGGDEEQRYKAYFEKLPAKKRELFGEDRVVRVKDLLPQDEAAAIARESARSSHDLYNKKQNLKLTIDGTVKIDASMEGLGDSFFFAERGGEKFLLIRGKHFTTSRAQLSSVDFLQVDSLEAMIERVREDRIGDIS